MIVQKIGIKDLCGFRSPDNKQSIERVPYTPNVVDNVNINLITVVIELQFHYAY